MHKVYSVSYGCVHQFVMPCSWKHFDGWWDLPHLSPHLSPPLHQNKHCFKHMPLAVVITLAALPVLRQLLVFSSTGGSASAAIAVVPSPLKRCHCCLCRCRCCCCCCFHNVIEQTHRHRYKHECKCKYKIGTLKLREPIPAQTTSSYISHLARLGSFWLCSGILITNGQRNRSAPPLLGYSDCREIDEQVVTTGKSEKRWPVTTFLKQVYKFMNGIACPVWNIFYYSRVRRSWMGEKST